MMVFIGIIDECGHDKKVEIQCPHCKEFEYKFTQDIDCFKECDLPKIKCRECYDQ